MSKRLPKDHLALGLASAVVPLGDMSLRSLSRSRSRSLPVRLVPVPRGSVLFSLVNARAERGEAIFTPQVWMKREIYG